MGHCFGVSKSTSAGSFRIGTNGSGPFLLEQMIAGWCVSNRSDAKLAAKAVRWFVHRDKMGTGLATKLGPMPRITPIRTIDQMREALSDTRDNSSWVFADKAIDRVKVHALMNWHLERLLSMRRIFIDHYSMSVEVPIDKEDVDMFALCAESLETVCEGGTAWASTVRSAANLLAEAYQKRRKNTITIHIG